ncbi:hypothetical protein LY76DRAFT_230119 [Colletotrichum caudatum]|nr:hypothetical protein LY76DRAFT_230119 [Colletotrichum caudatum]
MSHVPSPLPLVCAEWHNCLGCRRCNTTCPNDRVVNGTATDRGRTQGRVCVLKPHQPPLTTTNTHTLLFLLYRDKDTRFRWLALQPASPAAGESCTGSRHSACCVRSPPVNPLPSVYASNHMTALPIPSLQPPRRMAPLAQATYDATYSTKFSRPGVV